jgi:hypothetical protein
MGVVEQTVDGGRAGPFGKIVSKRPGWRFEVRMSERRS